MSTTVTGPGSDGPARDGSDVNAGSTERAPAPGGRPRGARPSLGPGAQARAGGVVVGVAVADAARSGGSAPATTATTDLVLCVADVAATGLPLHGTGALGVLRRNLDLRAQEVDAWPPLDEQDVLCVAAVVALAHLQDDAPTRLRALTAIIVEAGGVVRGGERALGGWLELVVRAVLEGLVDDGGDLGEEGGAVADAARAAVRVVRDVEGSGSVDDRLLEVLGAAGPVPAAAGALLGARFGWQPVLRGARTDAVGWLPVSLEAAVGLGVLAAGVVPEQVPVRGGRPGGVLPVERWDAPHTDRLDAPPTAGVRPRPPWRILEVALTASDAGVAGDGDPEGEQR